jgi:hypothetical protein
MNRTKSGDIKQTNFNQSTQKTMNVTKILVGLWVCLFVLEHVGRVHSVTYMRPTTYVDYLSYGLGRVWYHVGYVCASVASKVYNLWENLWDYLWIYLKDIGVTFKDIGNSCVDLLVTPKEFFVGFYERAKEFVYKYAWICLILFNVLVGLVVFWFKDPIMRLNYWVYRNTNLTKGQEHNPIGAAVLLFVML